MSQLLGILICFAKSAIPSAVFFTPEHLTHRRDDEEDVLRTFTAATRSCGGQEKQRRTKTSITFRVVNDRSKAVWPRGRRCGKNTSSVLCRHSVRHLGRQRQEEDGPSFSRDFCCRCFHLQCRRNSTGDAFL